MHSHHSNLSCRQQAYARTEVCRRGRDSSDAAFTGFAVCSVSVGYLHRSLPPRLAALAVLLHPAQDHLSPSGLRSAFVHSPPPRAVCTTQVTEISTALPISLRA